MQEITELLMKVQPIFIEICELHFLRCKANLPKSKNQIGFHSLHFLVQSKSKHSGVNFDWPQILIYNSVQW